MHPKDLPAAEPNKPFNETTAAWDKLARWIPCILFAIGMLSVVATQRNVGYAWDEAYYYEPSIKAARWLTECLSDGRFFDRDRIDLYWEEIHEHPSVQKFLSGFSLLFFERVIGPIAAMRLPMAFLFGGSLVLIYLLGRRAWDTQAALLAAISLAAMPQVFGFYHFATMEPVLLFMTLLLVYAFVRGLDSRGWSVFAGVALGALLATKMNGFFMIPPLVLWGYLYARDRCIHNFFWMMLLGPVFFVLLWPWLWPDPVSRVLDYFRFHATHQHTNIYFMGHNFGGGNPAPWYYPSVMIGLTVPLSVLGLSLAGIAGTLGRLKSSPLPVLFLFLIAANLIPASAPSIPKYDGVRLFLPVFPFLALMAGAGCELLMTALRHMKAKADLARDPQADDKPSDSFTRIIRFTPTILILIVLIEGAFGLSYHPYYLSYFNPIAGGIAGASRKGFEVTFWSEAVNQDVLDQLNNLNLIPPGSSLMPLALHEKCFEHLQRWGRLRRDIRIGGPPPYDFHLLLWRRGFFGRPEKMLADTPLFPPIRQWGIGDVPLVTLHRTGIEFEQAWPLYTVSHK